MQRRTVLRGRIRGSLAVLLLFPMTAAVVLPEAQAGARPADLNRAEARKIIVDLNRKWGKARVDRDRAALDGMLAPEFFVQLPEGKLTRGEFLDQITAPARGGKMTRFDVAVLTVEPDGDGWVAVIEEKLELLPADGGARVYSLWITRDRWKRFGDRWMALSSEAVGAESWRDGAEPPMRNW